MLPTTVCLIFTSLFWWQILNRIIDARGHYTVGKELIDQVLDKIRRVAGRYN